MKNLRHLDQAALRTLMDQLSEKPFKAAQIHDWLWKKNISSIEEMSNLSKALREKLMTEYDLFKLKIDHSQYSEDTTIKNRFVLHDKHFVEGVLIPTPERMTACISSQVGCSLSCKFCATGYGPCQKFGI